MCGPDLWLISAHIFQLNPYFRVRFNKKVSEYDQELPRSHTADQPTAPRGRVTEQQQQQNIRKTI